MEIMARTLDEILNEQKITDLGKDGTYIAVKFTPESQDKLQALAKSLELDNIVAKEKYHITVVYSRKPFTNFTVNGKLKKPWLVHPTELEIFDTQSGSRALVLRLDAPKLVDRHEYFEREFGATYDFDEYKTHVTLSYDVGADWQIPEDFDVKKMFKTLSIGEEYYEPLNNDWASKSTESDDKKDKE